MENSSTEYFLIKLSLEELKYIGGLLEQQPYKDSAFLIHKIQEQVNKQLDVENT